MVDVRRRATSTSRRCGSLAAPADVVVLPYDSREQVTSGVLIEAVAARSPVVATAFPHAVELLGLGAGLVVAHDDPEAIADASAGPDRAGSGRRRMAEAAPPRSRRSCAGRPWRDPLPRARPTTLVAATPRAAVA